MTNGRHMDSNLMGPSRIELASNQACRPEVFVEAPVGRRVPTALLAYDSHSRPMPRITSERRHDLACGHIEAAPDERKIFALERAGAAMVGKEFGQPPMRGIRFGDDQQSRRVLVQAMHDPGPLDPADTR